MASNKWGFFQHNEMEKTLPTPGVAVSAAENVIREVTTLTGTLKTLVNRNPDIPANVAAVTCLNECNQTITQKLQSGISEEVTPSSTLSR